MVKTINIVCSNCDKEFERPLKNNRKNQKNRFCSVFCMSEFRLGEGAPNWKGGKTNKQCVVCGELFEVPGKDLERRKTCSMECRNVYIAEWQKKYCWMNGLPSELHPNWKGGKSYEIYPKEFYNVREIIKTRDGGCVECMSQENLCVHHIDYNKKNNDEKNLITLCISCHAKTNFNRDEWKKRYETYAICNE